MSTKHPYTPIDCDFHDELESAATLKKRVVVVLKDEAGKHVTIHDVIVELGHAKAGEEPAEYMTFGSGMRFRLDQIVSIDGKLLLP